MFEIDIITLFNGYLIVFLAVIITAWLIALWKRHLAFRSERVRCHCRHCEAVFTFESGARWLRCPRCHGGLKIEYQEAPVAKSQQG
jgi:uncharacterized paraquat-inducible protein A